MCGPHHCLGRGASAPNSEILRRLLQLRQNASIPEQGCAGFSRGSANRCDQFTRYPGRTSSPLRPRLSCWYTQLPELGAQLSPRVWQLFLLFSTPPPSADDFLHWRGAGTALWGGGPPTRSL